MGRVLMARRLVATPEGHRVIALCRSLPFCKALMQRLLPQRLVLVLVDEADLVRTPVYGPVQEAADLLLRRRPHDDALLRPHVEGRVQDPVLITLNPDLERLPSILAELDHIGPLAERLLLHLYRPLPGVPTPYDVVVRHHRQAFAALLRHRAAFGGPVRAGGEPGNGRAAVDAPLLLGPRAPEDLVHARAAGAEGVDAGVVRHVGGLQGLRGDQEGGGRAGVVRLLGHVLRELRELPEVDGGAVHDARQQEAALGQAHKAAGRAGVPVHALEVPEHDRAVRGDAREGLLHHPQLHGVRERRTAGVHLHGLEDADWVAGVPQRSLKHVEDCRPARRREAAAHSLGVQRGAHDHGPAVARTQLVFVLRAGPAHDLQQRRHHALAPDVAVGALVEDPAAAAPADGARGAVHDQREGVLDQGDAADDGQGATVHAEVGHGAVQGGRARGVLRVHREAGPRAAKQICQPADRGGIARVDVGRLGQASLAGHHLILHLVAGEAEEDAHVSPMYVLLRHAHRAQHRRDGLAEPDVARVHVRGLLRREAKLRERVVRAAGDDAHVPRVHLVVVHVHGVLVIVDAHIPLGARDLRNAVAAAQRAGREGRHPLLLRQHRGRQRVRELAQARGRGGLLEEGAPGQLDPVVGHILDHVVVHDGLQPLLVPLHDLVGRGHPVPHVLLRPQLLLGQVVHLDAQPRLRGQRVDAAAADVAPQGHDGAGLDRGLEVLDLIAYGEYPHDRVDGAHVVYHLQLFPHEQHHVPVRLVRVHQGRVRPVLRHPGEVGHAHGPALDPHVEGALRDAGDLARQVLQHGVAGAHASVLRWRRHVWVTQLTRPR
mmetsp:Transcript_6355/g.18131  ORF Transcript_6355/g.18131 Transcript_6355/m.18131 type:complete len:830 (-) Transcript_6355:695-3184(-)